MKPVSKCLTAKMKLKADVAGNRFDVGGTLKMEQGKGLQLGITAMGLFEIARLEITPVDAQILNKFGKEYASVAYNDVDFLSKTGLDYNVIESLFSNRIFTPDGSDPDASLNDMNITVGDGEITIVSQAINGMQYTFVINTATGNLVETRGVYNGKVGVVCRYSDFRQFDGRAFPHKMEIAVENAGKPISVEFTLSNLRNTLFAFKKSNTASYKKIEIAELLKSIGK